MYVKADIRFDVHQGKHPEVFRPYVRVAVPKIFDVNIDDVKVPGPVKTKVVDAGCLLYTSPSPRD